MRDLAGVAVVLVLLPVVSRDRASSLVERVSAAAHSKVEKGESCSRWEGRH